MSDACGRVDAPPTTGRVAVDDLLEVLSDAECRRVLYHLRECEVATLDELERVVTESEGEARPALQADHLPRMADLGIVEYDPAWEYVHFPDDAALREWVDMVRRSELGQRRQ